MMIIMQFTLQIILLAVGFGVGYWLIITANAQQGAIKTFGQALGGVLIVMTLILEIFSAYCSMKISNRGYMQGGCPLNRMMNPMTNQFNNKDTEGRTEFERNTNTQMINPQGHEEEDYRKNENKLIKRNKSDRD